jgi:Permeases of the drug/metabolite transporter (DMT) superfamily
MDDEIYQDFKNNGTAHVLAVSGLHVGMTDLGALTLNTFRFLGAFLVVGVISYAKIRKVSRTTLKNAFYIGTSLVFVYIGATFGVKYTELSNVGFLCGLSVVFTPFMERFTFKRKIQKRVYIAAFMSVVGIMLLTLKSDFSINMDNIKGDLLCIMCAFAYSIEVILTEKAVDKEDVDPFHLGVFQLGVTGAYMLVLSFIFEHPHFPSTPSIWAGVIFLSLVCTGLAFIVQTIAQQYTSSSHVCIIYSLESVFSAIVAYFLAGDVLSTRAYFGAAVIVAALVVAELDFGGRSVEGEVKS